MADTLTPSTALLVHLPNELLLLLRPQLCISSLVALSRTNSLLRGLFWIELDLKAACLAVGVARPLKQLALKDKPVKPRVPDYRLFCVGIAAHARGCDVEECHEIAQRSIGHQTKAIITPELALALADSDLPAWISPGNFITVPGFFSSSEAYTFANRKTIIDGVERIMDDEMKLIDHLPLASLLATSPAVSQFYEDTWSVKNRDGITVLDVAQGLVLGYGWNVYGLANGLCVQQPITSWVFPTSFRGAFRLKAIPYAGERIFAGFSKLDHRLQCSVDMDS